MMNCFEKTESPTNAQVTAENDNEEPFASLKLGLTVILQDINPDLAPDGVTSKNYVDVEEAMSATQSLPANDDEILEPFLTNDAEEIEEISLEDDDEPVKRTEAEIQQALKVLETWSLFEAESSVRSRMRRNLHSYRNEFNKYVLKSLKDKQILQVLSLKFSISK